MVNSKAAGAASAFPAASDGISPVDVKHYVEQGYLIVKDLVTPEAIVELKRDIVKIARGEYPCEQIEPADPSLSDEEVLRSFIAVHNPHEISPVVKRFSCHPGVVTVLRRIVAAHLPFWDGRVKCMQSMFFAKSPGSPGQAWHQDEYYIPTRDCSLAGAWIAVDDATRENGCLWVLPGSHRNGYLYDQRPVSDLSDFDGKPESFGFDEGAEIPVEVKSGSVVFFNGYLLHRSRRNSSKNYRRALVSHYMNAWSRLPWMSEPDVPFSKLDTRMIFMVNGEDPDAHKGYVKNKVKLRKPAG